MLQKSCFLTLPFFEQISRQKKTHFGQFLVSKWEGGRHEPGPMGREPEGGFHPPWRVITTSRSETEWNVVNLEPYITRLHRGWNPAADLRPYSSCRPPLLGRHLFMIMAIQEWEFLRVFHLMCKINPAFKLTQWIQDQNIKLFSTLGATVAPATEGRQSTARHRRQNNDWFEIWGKLGTQL